MSSKVIVSATMRHFILYFLLIIIPTYGDLSCNSQVTCADCIGYARTICVWCSDKDYNGPRCRPEVNSEKWCSEVYNPKPNVESRNETSDSLTQLSPQKIMIRTRPGVPTAFNISYTPAKDYPLDVYYLMDTSYTMRRYGDTLKEQSKVLQELLLHFTNNVQLGVGSFVEKPGIPYAMPFHQAYSFKNDLRLTSNTDLFKKTIEQASFGSNWDDPEATLDALMQAMVCTDLIGWRNISRRVIVVCTDGIYHSAGDGKMIGAIKRNDMECHMINNTYSEALMMDYPSVGQINNVAKKQSIKIIFAGTENVRPAYERLQKKIYGSVYHNLGETENISEYIKSIYVDLTQNLRLDTTNVPNYIQITFDPPCNLNDTKMCAVQNRVTKHIRAELLVKECPGKDRVNDTIEVSLMGLREKIVIKLQLDCKCECEKNKYITINATECSGNGTYQCGICKCNPNSYGDKCDCDINSSVKEQKDKCRAVNETIECSGRGTCKCGKCIDCGSRFSGQFCESDDESCPRVRGVMCAGRGLCRGGACECDDLSRWQGDDCDCPRTDAMCIPPKSDKVCSGNGDCICGKCNCNDAATKNYTDVFCDYCEGCTEQRCQEINDYAICASNKTCNATDVKVIFVDEIEMSSSAWELERLCSAPLEERCSINYKYRYEKYTKELLLIVQKEKNCVTPVNIWVALGSTLGAVLLVGLLTTILWKVLVDLHDAREYSRFEEEFKSANWNDDDNPLYRSPGTTFSNPAFQGH